MRNLPPLNAIRAFEASARLGSMKDAAAELGVTHGAISRQVRLLEEWLRAPVFYRRHRGIVLTSSGENLFEKVKFSLETMKIAVEEFEKDLTHVQIRVDALPTFAVRWLIPRLIDFRRLQPHIEVILQTSNDPVESTSDESDVIIRGGPDTFYGFKTRLFLSDYRTPVCSPALIKRIPLDKPEELRNHTLLHSSSLPRVWNDWLNLAGLPDLKPAGVLHLDHFYLTLQCAIEGLGVAVGSRALTGDDLAAGRLIAPFKQFRLPARDFCAYVPEIKVGDSSIQTLCSWLEKSGSTTREYGSK